MNMFVGLTGFLPGIPKTTYAGYHNETPSFFATAIPTTYGANPAFSIQSNIISEPATDDGSNFSCQWIGYFLATTTETYTFYLSSDDGSYLWVGPTALSGFTTANTTVNNGGGGGRGGAISAAVSGGGGGGTITAATNGQNGGNGGTGGGGAAFTGGTAGPGGRGSDGIVVATAW